MVSPMVSPMVTFFTSYDYWEVHLVNNERGPCGKCQYYIGVGVLTGEWLQGMFPWLKIVDDDEIKCNIHPNCQCFLKRVLLPYDKPTITDPEAVVTQSRQLLVDYNLGEY